MPNVEIYFTEEFLTYLATSFGTMASKIYLLADDSEPVTVGDIVTLPAEVPLIPNANKEVTTTIEKHSFECVAKIKNINPRHKNKSVVLAGTMTELTWGTSSGTLTDLSPWGLSSANGLLQGSSVHIYDNMTGPGLWGETFTPTWGSTAEYGYSTEPYLFYCSDTALFVKENPTDLLAKEVFSRVFNSSTDYKMHIYRGSPELVSEIYGNEYYSYWASTSDFYSMTTTDFPYFAYPGANSTFSYSSTGELINMGSASSLTSFLYQTETGLMLGTFVDIQSSTTSTTPIDGFFCTNESIKIKKSEEEEVPLVLFGVHIDGGLNFNHQPGTNASGNLNFTIFSTPKISLSMDVIVI